MPPGKLHGNRLRPAAVETADRTWSTSGETAGPGVSMEADTSCR